MIIDAHTHIGKLGNSKFSESYGKNLDFLQDEMEVAGINHALILANFETDQAEPSTELAIRLVKESGATNLHVAGSIDMGKVSEHYTEKIDGFLERHEIVAVKLYPGYQQVFPWDKTLFPLYELCSQKGVPVIFHSGDTLNYADIRGKVRYSHPIHIDDVAVDFPNLKIVIAHLGNPWIADCAELLYKNENVYADISGLAISENFVDSSYGEMLGRQIRDLVTYSSAEKLLYGTDWPLISMDEYLKFMNSLGFSDTQLEKILSKNALELFKLNI